MITQMKATQNLKFRTRLLWLVLLVSAISYQSAMAVTFTDGFESGDLSKSTNGFKWNGMGTNPVVVTNFAKTGNASLKFIFPATANGEAWSEQRYKLGGNYNNVWLKADIFIPENYYCRNNRLNNNKGPFYVWSGAYTNKYIGANFDNWCISGNAYVTFDPSENGYDIGHYNTCLTLTKGCPREQGVPFVDRAKDLNKWHEWIVHARPATTSTSNDGVAEIWKDGVKVWYRYDLGYHSNVNNNFDQGYLMGYSNSGFDQETNIHYDNFVFSTKTINPRNVKVPLAPASLLVQ